MTPGERLRVQEATSRIEQLLADLLDADDEDDTDGMSEILDTIDDQLDGIKKAVHGL